MCYSKEVQLATGSIIVASTAFFYFRYSRQYRKPDKKWLLPALTTFLFAATLIGGHQIFEFLSLVTNNQIVYKIGLLISISGMLFYLIALEKLYNCNFYAKYFLLLIIAVGIHIFSIPMDFQAQSFYLKHNTASLWGSAWAIMFAYFHICAFAQRKLLGKHVSNLMVLTSLLLLADISFLLALSYSIWGYNNWGLDFCSAAPSIWCTFSVVQLITIPLFLSLLPKVLKSQPARTELPKKTALKYLLIALTFVGSFAILPIYKCFSTKNAFP